MRLFIADDSQIIMERLIQLVSDVTGIIIVGLAKRADTAIERINHLKPDVVILDIKMPGGNGIEVLKEVNKNKSKPIVIMLTNYPYPQYKEKCHKLDADFFLDKSDEFEKIPIILNGLVGNQKIAS